MTQPITIEGLSYFSNFLRETEAFSLIQNVNNSEWSTDLKRRVQHYGYRYDYKARSVTKEDYIGPLPEWLEDIGRRLHSEGFFSRPPDQAIINEYKPGQGIAAHIDCAPCFGEAIASLSLAAPCIMEFSKTAAGKDRRELWLEPNSLLILTGDARYRWRHAIRPRKSDYFEGMLFPRHRRLSVTFRTVEAN